MSSFTAPLDTRRDHDEVILLRDLVFFMSDAKTGAAITVPLGFRSDGASIPWLLRWFAGHPFGSSLKSAVVHDWVFRSDEGRAQLATTGPRTRRQAAHVMATAMRVDGVHPFRRRVIWLGLRLGDWMAWRQSLGTAVIDEAVVQEVRELRSAVVLRDRLTET